jgi:hypothetical protein
MQIKHLFKPDREAQLDRAHQRRSNAPGNGTTGSNAPEENFDTNQPMALERVMHF